MTNTDSLEMNLILLIFYRNDCNPHHLGFKIANVKAVEVLTAYDVPLVYLPNAMKVKVFCDIE